MVIVRLVLKVVAVIGFSSVSVAARDLLIALPNHRGQPPMASRCPIPSRRGH